MNGSDWKMLNDMGISLGGVEASGGVFPGPLPANHGEWRHGDTFIYLLSML